MITMVVDIFMDAKLSVIDHAVQQLFKMFKLSTHAVVYVQYQCNSLNRGSINQPQCPWLALESNFEKKLGRAVQYVVTEFDDCMEIPFVFSHIHHHRHIVIQDHLSSVEALSP